MGYLKKPTVFKAAALLLGALVLGAAGAASGQDLAGRMADKNAPLYQVGQERWITLCDFAHVVGGSLDEESGSPRVELAFDEVRAVFLVESRRVLFNGEIAEMSRPARRINGMPAIPYAFADRLSRPDFSPGRQLPDERPEEAEKAPGLHEILSRAMHPGLEETIAEAVQERPRILVIDPGHGGKDAGAIGPHGLTEKAVALDISLRLRDYLQRKHPDLEIIMTRSEDTFVSLGERVRIANEAKADLFISVHANDARYNRHTANGFETFFPASKPVLATAGQEGRQGGSLAWASPLEPVRAVEKSRYLAELMQEELSDVYVEEIPNRGVKRRNFYVLRDTMMPAVLVEVGFISNPLIEANLRQPRVRRAIAEALGKGIEGYMDMRPVRGKVEVETNGEVPRADGTH